MILKYIAYFNSVKLRENKLNAEGWQNTILGFHITKFI